MMLMRFDTTKQSFDDVKAFLHRIRQREEVQGMKSGPDEETQALISQIRVDLARLFGNQASQYYHGDPHCPIAKDAKLNLKIDSLIELKNHYSRFFRESMPRPTDQVARDKILKVRYQLDVRSQKLSELKPLRCYCKKGKRTAAIKKSKEYVDSIFAKYMPQRAAEEN